MISVMAQYLSDEDLETIAWIIHKLYDGAPWAAMAEQRPEISDVMVRLGLRDFDFADVS